MAVEAVNWRRRRFPFNAEQTVNIVAEVGPLFAMFIVNGLYGISGGTWALIICTVLSLLVTLWVLGRPPIMPFIGGSVSISFGALTLITGDPMWVQIKVTLFNALVAFLLWIGLRAERNFFRFVFHKTFHFTEEGWHNLTRNAAVLRGYRCRERGGAVWVCRRPHHHAQSRLHGHRYLDFLQDISSSCPRRSCSSGLTPQ